MTKLLWRGMVVGLSLAACTKVPAMSSQSAASDVSETVSFDGYLVLLNRELVPSDQPEPGGFYVLVKQVEGGYEAVSEVKGQGEFAEAGRQGWLELRPMSFVPAQTARPPVQPYIEGVMTDQGFVPSSADVVGFFGD